MKNYDIISSNFVSFIKDDESGFTLVELSLVILIIGLLAVGVLQGQDLIRAASIRSAVSQIDSMEIATNSFRVKFGFIPGDIPQSKASAFGLTNVAGVGNGNSSIEGLSGAGCDGERPLFWAHLSEEEMLEGFTLDGAQGGYTIATDGVSNSGTFPVSELGLNSGMMAYTDTDRNHYLHIGLQDNASSGACSAINTLTPAEAYGVDNKLDDGDPTRGVVTAQSDIATTLATSATAGCLAASVSEYNLGDDSILCQIRLRFNR